MASSAPPPPRQASRWGSLLQQAVAGVESRLDNILAEGDDGQPAEPGAEGPKAEKQPSLKAAMSASPAPRGEKGLSRASSNSRTHDRLQERLAKAMVKKDNARLEGAPSPTSSTVPSRTGTPAAGADSPRASSDLQEPGTSGEMSRASTDVNGQPASDSLLVHEPTQAPGMLGPYLTPERGPSSRQSMDSQASLRSTHSTRDAEVSGSRVPTNHTSLASSAEEYDTVIAQMRADHETAELRRQEETHSYMERIDALQAKLHYLSRETVDSARSAMASAPAGSLDKKLADKDEQIALLMEEGQNLSKMELKHTTAIKKLRAKAKEDERQLLHVQSKLEKSEREAAEHKERARRAETAEKRANERLKSVARLEKELEKVRSERDSAGALLSSLKAELAQAKTQAAEAEKKAQTGALEAERKVVADLRDDLSNAKIEKELCEERARADARAVREKADAERERAKAVEAELRSEQSMLESKMEALRARAEEVSTGATGDAQAKLLRQIETLQTQYAVASENWQGIETSLVTRVTNLERDKEELTRKEGDIRRKAREINLKSKRLEAGLESATGSVQTLEHELAEGREQLEKLRRRLDESEVALREAQAGFARDRAAWDSLTTLRIEQERSRWKEEALLSPGAYQPSRTESPTAFSRRGPPSDVYGFQSRRGDVTLHERPGSRRTSTQPARTPDPDAPTPPRQDSMAQMVPFPETPSIHTMDGDEAFDAHSSPHRTVADMISGSVGGAGPSVQLVERMSAAVRRLESEKAGHREELARLQTQRDEARTEVVSLMREVEAKRAADERIAALEAEVRAMGARYETTLEMLGEKSELVDELRNDVADVKKIYRELVESTMR